MVECDWVVVKVWLFQTCNFTFCECGAEWRWAGSSEIEVLLVKVKVVTVPNVCSLGEPVDWFSSAILSYWDLARVKEIPVQRRNEEEDFLNVALACEDGNWSWAHKTVLSWGSTFIDLDFYFIMLQYHPLVLLCMIYSEQQLERGCSIVYNGPDIIGDENENLEEGSAVEKPWVIVIDQWSGASERLVSWWIMEWIFCAWCFHEIWILQT